MRLLKEKFLKKNVKFLVNPKDFWKNSKILIFSTLIITLFGLNFLIYFKIFNNNLENLYKSKKLVS